MGSTQVGWWHQRSGAAAFLVTAGLVWGCGSSSVTVVKRAPLFVLFEKGDRLGCCGLALPKDGSAVVVARVDTIAGRSWAWAAKLLPRGEVAWEREWSPTP